MYVVLICIAICMLLIFINLALCHLWLTLPGLHVAMGCHGLVVAAFRCVPSWYSILEYTCTRVPVFNATRVLGVRGYCNIIRAVLIVSQARTRYLLYRVGRYTSCTRTGIALFDWDTWMARPSSRSRHEVDTRVHVSACTVRCSH